jgi:hypothetical protein
VLGDEDTYTQNKGKGVRPYQWRTYC